MMAQKQQQQSKFEDSNHLSNIGVYVVTWNINSHHPQDDKIYEKLFDFKNQISPTFVVVAFQEIVKLNFNNIVVLSNKEIVEKWIKTITNALSQYGNYELIAQQSMVGLFTMVYVQKNQQQYISNVIYKIIKYGFRQQLGNKGGVIIKLKFYDSIIAFVNVHLPAGQKNNDDRLAAFDYISHKSLKYQPDWIIVFGDMNFRINLPQAKVVDSLQEFNTSTVNEHKLTIISWLKDHDQLLQEKQKSHHLRLFEEHDIQFTPTYKYDINSDQYDTIKKRIPSFTDRILFRKVSNIDIMDALFYHNIGNSVFSISDHRPVCCYIQTQIVVAKLDPQDLSSLKLIPIMTQRSIGKKCCQICDRPFTLLVKKHYCKRCQRAVCDKCSPGRGIAPKDNKMHRQCNLCKDEISRLGKFIEENNVAFCTDTIGLKWLNQQGISKEQSIAQFQQDRCKLDESIMDQNINKKKMEIVLKEIAFGQNYSIKTFFQLYQTKINTSKESFALRVINNIETVLLVFLKTYPQIVYSSELVMITMFLLFFGSVTTVYNLLKITYFQIFPHYLWNINMVQLKDEIQNILDINKKLNTCISKEFLEKSLQKYIQSLTISKLLFETTFHIINSMFMSQNPYQTLLIDLGITLSMSYQEVSRTQRGILLTEQVLLRNTYASKLQTMSIRLYMDYIADNEFKSNQNSQFNTIQQFYSQESEIDQQQAESNENQQSKQHLQDSSSNNESAEEEHKKFKKKEQSEQAKDNCQMF